MARRKYFIKLSDDERNQLTQIVSEGKEPKKKIMRARILLMSDTAQPKKYSLTALAELLGTTDTTIQTVRTEYATLGLETTLRGNRSKPRGHYSRFNQEVVKALKEMAKEEPPIGHKKWSSRLLCEEAVKRRIVESITPTTMLRIIGEDKTE